MQGIAEAVFDGVYLLTVLILGLIMCFKSKSNKKFRLFGLMTILLVVGDAFHLVPRVYALLTTGLDSYVLEIGLGKLITSITVTVFYLLLYHFWRLHYEIKGKSLLTIAIWLLAIARITLCLLPQNQWFSEASPVFWGVLRNIPFLIMGIIIIILFRLESKKNLRGSFRNAWLAILLSFSLYIPVVLWADYLPIIGMLMIPKTIAYVWLVFMGFKEFLADLKLSRSW